MEILDSLLNKVKNASYKLALLDSNTKNNILLDIKNSLIDNKDKIVQANKIDLNNAKDNNMSDSLIDRLSLDNKKIESIAYSIDSIVSLKDPIGEIIDEWVNNDGLVIQKVRVPFGVIACIYEARPNVTIDICVLCLKTSNACVLRGGKESINTNKMLSCIIKDVLKKYDLEDSVLLIEDLSHEVVNELITKKAYIDLVIPRGGKNLINNVVNNAKVPYIETGAGNCHMYVHEKADFKMALDLIVNAKVQRPSVCNAIESILVDKSIAPSFLSLMKAELDKYNVEIRGCTESLKYIDCMEASDEDFYTEYNDYIVSLKIVDDIDCAINHINSHSTHHSECIVTENLDRANLFMNALDSACVYHNASTRFTDGGQFGFGAELGISTQKMHARGPLALREMTSYQYKIYGNGQIRE